MVKILKLVCFGVILIKSPIGPDPKITITV